MLNCFHIMQRMKMPNNIFTAPSVLAERTEHELKHSKVTYKVQCYIIFIKYFKTMIRIL